MAACADAVHHHHGLHGDDAARPADHALVRYHTVRVCDGRIRVFVVFGVVGVIRGDLYRPLRPASFVADRLCAVCCVESRMRIGEQLPPSTCRARFCRHYGWRVGLGDHGDCWRRDPGATPRRRDRHDHDGLFTGCDCRRAGRRDARRALQLGRPILFAGGVVAARLGGWVATGPFAC